MELSALIESYESLQSIRKNKQFLAFEIVEPVEAIFQHMLEHKPSLSTLEDIRLAEEYPELYSKEELDEALDTLKDDLLNAKMHE